jgi:hypothetical protein
MVAGCLQRNRPFFRTPKRTRRHALRQALAAAREEATLMLGLWFSAWAVSRIPTFDGDLPGLIWSPDLSIWVTVLLIQSIPYAAAVVVSLVSALDLPGGWIGEAATRQPRQNRNESPRKASPWKNVLPEVLTRQFRSPLPTQKIAVSESTSVT